MSWSAELWHLLRRDVRRSGWLLLVYVIMLVLAVTRASQLTGAFSGRLAPVGQAVLLFMPLLVAMAVHADSAIRVDAFWAVLPVRAYVIVTSKLLYILLLVGLWTVAVCVVMSKWHVLSVAAAADIGFADMFATLTLLMLGTALVTAGCASLASVGVVLGAAFALSAAIIFSSNGMGWGFTAREWWAIAVPMMVGAVVLLAQRYRVRTSSRVSRGVSIATGAAVVLFPTLTLDARVAEPRTPTASAASSAVVLRLPLQGQPECERNRLTLPLEVTSPSTWRVELMRPHVDVSLADGSHVELSSDRWMQSAGIWGPMLPPADARVVADSASTRVRRTDIVFELPRDGSSRVCGHVDDVALRILMRVATPREVLRVPLASSSTVTASGYRGRIASVDVADTTVSIRLRLSMLTSTSARNGTALGELDYAIADPRQHRVVRLSAEGSHATVMFTADDGSGRPDSSGFPSGEEGEQWDTSALPGLTIMSSRMHLHAYRANAARPSDLRSWSDGAVLLAIAPVWHTPEVRNVHATVKSASMSSTAGARH